MYRPCGFSSGTFFFCFSTFIPVNIFLESASTAHYDHTLGLAHKPSKSWSTMACLNVPSNTSAQTYEPVYWRILHLHCCSESQTTLWISSSLTLGIPVQPYIYLVCVFFNWTTDIRFPFWEWVNMGGSWVERTDSALEKCSRLNIGPCTFSILLPSRLSSAELVATVI